MHENVPNLFQSSTSLNQLFLCEYVLPYFLKAIEPNHENDLDQYLMSSFMHIYAKMRDENPEEGTK